MVGWLSFSVDDITESKPSRSISLLRSERSLSKIPESVLPAKSIFELSPLLCVRGPTGRSGLLGGNTPGLFRELVLGGRGFLGGMAGTEGFCKSSFGSLSGLSLSHFLRK